MSCHVMSCHVMSCMYVCMYVLMYFCMWVSMYVCLSGCLSVCMYVHHSSLLKHRRLHWRNELKKKAWRSPEEKKALKRRMGNQFAGLCCCCTYNGHSVEEVLGVEEIGGSEFFVARELCCIVPISMKPQSVLCQRISGQPPYILWCHYWYLLLSYIFIFILYYLCIFIIIFMHLFMNPSAYVLEAYHQISNAMI